MSATPATGVRFGRLERRGLILGFSAFQVTALGVALVVVIAAEYAAGVTGVLVTTPAWALFASMALISIGGRPVVVWLPLITNWLTRRALRATRYLARPGTDRQPDQLALPGIPGRLAVVASPTTGAALMVDPKAATITAVVELSGRGFILEDPGSQDRRVAGWSRVLASLCQQPAIVRLQVLHRRVPGGATRVRRWWAQHACADVPWPARVVADLVSEAEEGSERHECLLALAVRAPRGARRRLNRAAMAAVEQRLTTLTDALSAAELDVHGWLDPGRLQRVLRAAYDPAGASRGENAEPSNGLVGPMGLVEDWAWVRTDSAYHAVYWVQEWPRSDVHPDFLQPVLLTPGARRTLTLIAEPLPPRRALREIRRAKAEHVADAAQRARIGQLEDEATRAEAEDLARREQDLVAGHGDLRFVGLLTVTADTRDDLGAACAATENAAARAMCELRRLVGQQGQAHAAAALPLARGLL